MSNLHGLGKSILTLVVFFIISQISNAEQIQILQSYKVLFASQETMNKITQNFEITGRDKIMGSFEVIVPADKVNYFLDLAPNAELLSADISLEAKKVFKNSRLLWEKSGYKNLTEVQEYISGLASKLPNLVKVETYGSSKVGHNLMVLKLSDNVTVDENEPKILITAATHGDEIITTEVVLNLIEQLLTSANDPRVRKMISEHELYFIPVVNPDGFSQQDRYDSGRDPNRSYPGPHTKNPRPTPSIAPLVAFVDKHKFAGTLDFHAHGGLIMYPWSWTYDVIQDKTDLDWFSRVTKSMAETNGYTSGQISDVIYVAEGSSADYYYWKNKTKAVAIEIGLSKAPPPSQISSYVNQVTEATWRFIEAF